MAQFEPEEFGARLRGELDRLGLDVKGFQAHLRSRTNVRGTSYASVWSYVNGQAPQDGPRREVVEAMAEILGVLPSYLLHGGGRTALDVETMREEEEATDPRVAPIIRALASAERRLGPLRHASFLGHDQVLMGLTFAFLQSGGRSVLSYTPEQVEEAMLTLVWLIYFPVEALGVVDIFNRPGGREEYFMAAATVLRLAVSGHDSGFPLNAIESARELREAWEQRLPHRMTDDAIAELERDRGRGSPPPGKA